jgi:hypothetical protein
MGLIRSRGNAGTRGFSPFSSTFDTDTHYASPKISSPHVTNVRSAILRDRVRVPEMVGLHGLGAPRCRVAQ